MPNAPLYDRTGKSVGSVELADALFAAPVNAAVLHQVVTAQLAGRRLGTHDRHLGYAVLPQDSDCVAHRLGRVGVYQVGQRAGLASQYLTNGRLLHRTIKPTAQKSVR